MIYKQLNKLILRIQLKYKHDLTYSKVKKHLSRLSLANERLLRHTAQSSKRPSQEDTVDTNEAEMQQKDTERKKILQDKIEKALAKDY